MPCSRSRRKLGKRCDFVLRAVRPDLNCDTIHVYAHSQHNHPLESEEKRAICRKSKDLMPDANPPTILRTPDNLEWTFVQTFSDYDQMQNFRQKRKCLPKREADEIYRRIRFSCTLRNSQNCKFMLMALKTTKQRYHVYKYGKHNSHLVQTNMQNQRNVKQKVIDDEEDENEENEENEEEEKVDGEKKDIKLIKDEHPEEEDAEERLERLNEVKIIEIIEGNSREETLKKKLAKANRKIYKWMAGIEPNEIEGTIGEWDKLSLLKMVEMADLEIREHPQKLNLWHPWLKCAIPKCAPQIKGFNVRFANLIKLAFD